MPPITDNIRPELARLLPLSVLKEVTCFVFYDKHPRDQKLIDITVATGIGEVKEYYKRELVHSLNLGGRYRPTEIKIIRNFNCDLFYLVEAGDELTIVSRKERPQIHRHVFNVDRYGVEDGACRGQGGLKVVLKDDAVPLVFDDNFTSLGDKAFVLDGLHADDSLPILTELMRKLTQTKYSVKCNESTLKGFLSLRQASALASYQKIRPNTEESIFNVDANKEDEVLRIKSLTPWVKLCNRKIVVALAISYTNSTVPIENIHMLLHWTNKPSLVYTTKMFQRTDIPPFWVEKKSPSLLKHHDIAIVAVVDVDETASDYLCKIELTGVISYTRMGKEHVVPFDQVVLTKAETTHGGFSALASVNKADEMLSLAVVATTFKTELILKHIRLPDEPPLTIPDVFCHNLNMSRLDNTDRAIVYRVCPHYFIGGTMLVFPEQATDDCYTIFAYARNSSQLGSLINHIHEGIPQKVIAITPNLKISLKSEKKPRIGEEALIPPIKIHYDNYATSLMEQSNILIEYLDVCMSKMGESKDVEIRGKIGTEIDIMANGLPRFLEFRTKMLNIALKGAKSLKADDGDETGTISKAGSDMDMATD